ncbi:DUF4384 domain-containing protein [Ostreiculturibacter nitratireducens]|uniref:DUF4384 domain-containing protein n=1 Tax=Ostreiculturibacter nitratireducens TaxID=3075226 RepID=UPI0031B59395
MRHLGIWLLGITASLLAHALAALIVFVAYAPHPVTPQKAPESRLHLETEEVRSQDAVARAPDAELAAEGKAQGSTLAAGRIPQSDATALVPAAEPAALRSGAAEAGPALSAQVPSAKPVPSVAPAAPATLRPDAAEAGPALAALVPSAGTALAVEPTGQSAETAPPDIQRVPPRTAKGVEVPTSRAEGDAASPLALPETHTRAELAWQFGDRIVTDPTALSTILAFVSPQSLDASDSNAGRVRDDLTGILTGVDCARLSAVFLPETGTIELRGHVPDLSMRAAVLEAMRSQVGDGLPVTANLLHLPRPQCGALTGIADVGLPQSTDQFTNARLIGETAHATEYDYTEGQRLQFDLTAPDYDAYVYVDFFNAAGEVIHLVPNSTIPLERHAARSVFGVGRDRPGQPSLRITIGPPFGQEIAAAFATSVPLYDELRPIVEPAESYLAFLKKRVAASRAQTPGFKGEWVYFFITTSAASQ